MTDLRIDVPDGTVLEAELALPASSRALVVLVHPHPAYGGSMHGGLIDELFRALPAQDVGALRFNFRGVGSSTGSYDKGRGERADVAAAVAAAAGLAEGRTLLTCGWSFGAEMTLTLTDPAPEAFILVAAPLSLVEEEAWAIATDPRPKLLLVPENDQYRKPESAIAATEGWTATTIAPIAGADHFLAGHGDEVAAQVLALAGALSRPA